MLVQYAMRPRWCLGNFYLRVGEKKHMNPFPRAVDANCRNAASGTHANTFSVVTRGVKLNPYTFPSTRTSFDARKNAAPGMGRRWNLSEFATAYT